MVTDRSRDFISTKSISKDDDAPHLCKVVSNPPPNSTGAIPKNRFKNPFKARDIREESSSSSISQENHSNSRLL